MEKRRLGRTGHMSSILTLGCYAIGFTPQREADEIIKLALEHGVNHLDVAPTYGEAELRLRKWMREHRDDFFLACKTRERTREGASAEMSRSLERLGVDHFDLYQLHGLDDLGELEVALGEGGAMEAITAAREEGVSSAMSASRATTLSLPSRLSDGSTSTPCCSPSTTFFCGTPSRRTITARC